MSLYNQALADVRSTGAGIKCLYCTPVFGWPDVFTPELLIQLILNPTHPSMEDIFGMCGDVQKAKRDYVCALYTVGIAKIAPKKLLHK